MNIFKDCYIVNVYVDQSIVDDNVNMQKIPKVLIASIACMGCGTAETLMFRIRDYVVEKYNLRGAVTSSHGPFNPACTIAYIKTAGPREQRYQIEIDIRKSDTILSDEELNNKFGDIKMSIEDKLDMFHP